MTDERVIRLVDCELDETLTLDAVAEAAGARLTLVSRLVRMGLLDTVRADEHTVLLPTSAVLRLRRMQRLRRDLRVNFTGAAIILDLVERVGELNRELAQMRRLSDEG